ncbi:thioester domain-containing protein [Cellulosimicrobium sp. TH-20]|uniref:thioester domain-containing protein n=1 Tax=Cellulosimicrobium sp. TH-20 TaxID=1980001 RepID=UPI001643E79D|nr:thioester domain-containing protein [Cellulosimicrobium sp. TH-20]
MHAATTPTSRNGAARLAAWLAAACLVLVVLVAGAPPTRAMPNPDGGTSGPRGIFTELSITSLGAGQAVAGFTAPAGFDPLAGYPADVPAGSTADDASFAGTIQVTDTVSGQTASTYCIDLLTDTEVGVNYELGTWDEANVPNLGYIGYILDNYYPITGEPAGAPNANARAAAVQSAIWFFSDSYVLATTDAVRPLVAQIVADALANGPAPEPVPPTLEVTPETLDAPSTGEVVGPFTVESDGPAILHFYGIEVFSDPEGTTPLADGATVEPGATLWARITSPTGPHAFVLDRQVSVLESTVYLYDGTNVGREAAQKLILAQPSTLTRRAGALLEPFDAGSLDLTKIVAGDGAGLQSDVVLDVLCTEPEGEGTVERSVTIPAGAAAGEHTETLAGLPTGWTCVVTESDDGDNGSVVVTDTVVEPESVVIGDATTVSVTVTNTYDIATGGLLVRKAVDGPAAGTQGPITLALTCDDPDGAFDQVVELPGGLTGTDNVALELDGIPAGTTCTVTETVDGSTATTLLTQTVVTPESVTVAEDGTTELVVTNTYDPAPTPTPTPTPGPTAGPTPAPGSAGLASTGADAATALVLALLLVLGGLATVALVRRRA